MHPVARLLLFLLLLFFFLVSIKLLGGTIKTMGRGAASGLFEHVANPFAGLAVGILATVLVQSSSVTTATIVAMVGSGTLPVTSAVPMIMGANIGTSITNTIVALGHVRQSKEFELAFAGATMHDFFNLMAVAVFLPIELLTAGGFAVHGGGILTEAAVQTAHLISPGLDLTAGAAAEAASSGGSWRSPIKVVVGASAKWITALIAVDPKSPTTLESIGLFAVSLGGVFASLVLITKNMRLLIADRAEKALNRALEKSGLIGIAIGALLTVAVQSSSITTSLLVPMIAAGVLSIRNAFPITLGANMGTTVTAMLAALVTGSWGLVIALVHLIFNLSATLVLYPFPAVRYLPVRMATALARLTLRNRLWAVAYVVVAFILMPLAGMMLFKE